MYYIYYLNGGKEKRDDWEKNWKTILLNNKDNLSPNDKFKLDKKLFCEMCLKKQFKDENKIKQILLEYDEIYMNLKEYLK